MKSEPVGMRCTLSRLRETCTSPHVLKLATGVETHTAALEYLYALARWEPSAERLVQAGEAALPEGYTGNTRRELAGMAEGALAKLSAGPQGSAPAERYDPGEVGPIPLGYAGGEVVFRHRATKEVTRVPFAQLASPTTLLMLAPMEFWARVYPKFGRGGVVIGIDYLSACDGLIQAARRAGAIDVTQIRGVGVWQESDRLVVNLGGEAIESAEAVYSAPARKLNLRRDDIPIADITEFLDGPAWTTPSASQLLLGWAASSILSGALPWRVHVGITGPAQAGKSTIIGGVKSILHPWAISREGLSTEAGIRQSIGHDARPMIIDELEPESARDSQRVARIVKLMRSASSASGEVARGTPDGHATNYNVRASFLVAAINLYRISAADTSRLVKLEMRARAVEETRVMRPRIVELAASIAGCGPAFVQIVIDHAADLLASIAPLHRALPVARERQADNLATLLAGYWVVHHRRAISQSEADKLAGEHAGAVESQGESSEADDATECLNALLGYALTYEAGNERVTKSVGDAIKWAEMAEGPVGRSIDAIAMIGLKIEEGGLVIANSHPGLARIYAQSRWDGGLWVSALSRLPGAEKLPLRRFAEGVRSRAVRVPLDTILDPHEGPPF